MSKLQPLISAKAQPLKGSVRVPGDKSMSHRSLMLGLLTEGEETMVSGILEGEDVICTADAVRLLGGKVSANHDGLWRIFGAGLGNLCEPAGILDMGNSGTSTRLLMGLVGGHEVTATFTGDASLSKRPMKRVTDPLTEMGAQFLTREGGCLPLTMRGGKLKAITYETPVASAQIKSAILLAGLNAEGTTTVIEKVPTRDHTENMLQHFGVKVKTERLESGSYAISVEGGQKLQGCAVDIPADPSSAAFPVVAALLVEGSEIKLPHIGINERRIGLYDTLKEMGADISFTNEKIAAGEPVADLIVKGTGPLKGITVPAERVASMIDEFPILAVAASCANGTTTMTDLGELRVKESDRLAKMAEGLEACGVKLEEGEDSLIIHGTGKPPKGGALIDTALDHRIAMSFLVLGMVSDEPIEIDDARPINTSFPGFVSLMEKIGADISEVTEDLLFMDA